MTKLIYSSKWDPIWGEELEVASRLMLQSSEFYRKQVLMKFILKHELLTLGLWLQFEQQLDGENEKRMWLSYDSWCLLNVIFSWNKPDIFKYRACAPCFEKSEWYIWRRKLKMKHNVESTFKSLFLNHLLTLFQDWWGLMNVFHVTFPFSYVKIKVFHVNHNFNMSKQSNVT